MAGHLINEKEPVVTILRVYFTRLEHILPKYKLDPTNIYCIDGETKTVSRCQVEITNPNPKEAGLRFLKDGRVLLDDEMEEPSFFELNENWWMEHATYGEILARSK